MLRRLALVAGVLVCANGFAAAQGVDDIIAKSIAAHGGAAKLKSVQSMRLTGTMSVTQSGGQTMDISLVVEQKRPKMLRADFNVQGTTNTQAYDGRMGWLFMPAEGMTSPQPAPSEVLKDLDEQADMDLPYMDYQSKGNKVELVGKEMVGAAETYKLKITLRNGDIRDYFLDAKTYLPVRTDGKRVVNGSEVDTETLISDYRDVNGMMMPHVVESRMPSVVQKVTLQKIELNVPIEDSRFKMPAAK
jgi:outer membrane lipoprotein-sorting protein